MAASAGIPFSLAPLDHSQKGFERLLTPADYRAAVAFDGDLFLCGGSSLSRYATDGRLKQVWYAGRDLPPYRLRKLAVRRGIGAPELWITTDGAGVLIYDGARFKQLLPKYPGLRKLSALLPLSDGRVVLGTDEAGLYVTDGKRLELLHPQFAATKVTALAGDEDELWIGTRDRGAWLWRGGESDHFEAELPDPQVLSIFAAGDATWVGTPLGVAEFSHRRLMRVLAEGVFAQALAVRSGVLSIGTVDEGVVNVPLSGRMLHTSASPRLVSKPDGSHGQDVAALQDVVALEEIGAETVAISPSAALRLPSGEPLVSQPDPVLGAAHISALHVDNRSRLWIGYFDSGLDILTQGSGEQLTHIENDVVFCVNRIKEDLEQGTIAVATANGLALFDGGGQLRQILDGKSGLIASHVTDVLFRKADREDASSLAIATPAGISFLEGHGISSVSAFEGLVNNHVYTLAQRDGSLLAGTLGGVSWLRNGLAQSSYTTANSNLRQNWITASVVAGDQIYLGTYGSGVMRMDRNSSLSSFREFADKRFEINPNALLATAGFVYAGTAADGLAILRLGETRWHFIQDGLPSLNVTALASHAGLLYIGTDAGLVTASELRLNP